MHTVAFELFNFIDARTELLSSPYTSMITRNTNIEEKIKGETTFVAQFILRCQIKSALHEGEGCRVNAVTQTGWLRAVVEDMPEVGITATTKDLSPDHKPSLVLFLGDILRGNRLIIARPTSS